MNLLNFEKASPEILSIHINDFFVRKLIYNNYFGIDLNDTSFIKTEHSLILRKAFVGFYRLYIMSDNEEDLSALLNLVGKDHSINIPTKKDITIWENVLFASGFYNFAIYERYFYNKKVIKRGAFIECWAIDSDFQDIKNNLYNTFSPITGWLPTDNELKVMIVNKQILVSRDNYGLSALFIFTINNRRCDYNAWIGLREQGLDLFLNMLNYLAEKDITIIYAWINQKNIRVKRIYQKFGFKHDGLYDYTYIK